MSDFSSSSNKKSFLKISVVSALIFSLFLGTFVYFKYYFVFGEGVKSGYLNFATRKGNVFKTYEGKIIQEGFGANKKNMGSVSSYEFEFSVLNEDVFHQLEMGSGKYFDLHYVEYHGVLPWRGNTVYVVDKILSAR